MVFMSLDIKLSLEPTIIKYRTTFFAYLTYFAYLISQPAVWIMMDIWPE